MNFNSLIENLAEKEQKRERRFDLVGKSMDSAKLNPDPPKKGVLSPGGYLEVLNDHPFHFTEIKSSHSGGSDRGVTSRREEHHVMMRDGDIVRYIGPIQAGEKTLYKFIYFPQDDPSETVFYVEDVRKFLKGIGY